MSTVEVCVRLAFTPAGPVKLEPSGPRAVLAVGAALVSQNE